MVVTAWVGFTVEVKVVLRVSVNDIDKVAVVETLELKVVFNVSVRLTLIPD